MFSKACQYGIRGVLFIAKKSLRNEPTKLKQIAEEIDAPEAFTAKVLQKLVKQDIVRSNKGPKGGFFMERAEVDKVKLIQIVHTIDGDDVFKGCGLGLPQCDAEQPCPIHHEFLEIRTDLKNMLSNTSVYELATGLNSGLTFLKR